MKIITKDNLMLLAIITAVPLAIGFLGRSAGEAPDSQYMSAAPAVGYDKL